MSSSVRTRRAKATPGAASPRPWWGDGPAPLVQWPGVTIEIPATWSKKRGRWESHAGRYYFDMDAADRAERFFPTFFTHHIGEFAGQPFALMPYQAKLLTRPLFGWKRASDGFRRFRKVFAFIPKGGGKALALDTPIPTPDGWSMMGDLRVGDRVCGADGRVCAVTHASNAWTDRRCYELLFSDGARIVASGEHLWRTTAQRNGRDRHDRGDRPKLGDPDLVTTRQIADTLRTPVSMSRHPQAKWNHRVDLGGALDLPERDLPIPPYTLGAWLGDGDNDSSRITNDRRDHQILDEIARDGVEVRAQASHSPTTGRYSIGAGPRGGDQSLRRSGLVHTLKALGLLHNKHIPSAYLRASIDQRLALLQGLMDTDGTIGERGAAEFSVTCERLARDACELITSLGYKVRMRTGVATLRGVVVGERYRLVFRPVPDRPVFRLRRKAQRTRPVPARRMLANGRRIVGCAEVASVPVRCITVDSHDGMFLAGRQMVPTHNSPWGAGTGIYLTLCDGEEAAETYAVAGDKMQARIVFDHAKILVETSPDLQDVCEVLRDSIVYPDTRSTYKVLSSDAATKHGFRPSAVIFDELHNQRNRDLYEALKKSMVKRRQPVMIIITHAGVDDESLCYEEYEYSKGVLSGAIEDDTCLPVIFEATADDDPGDPAVWARVNPGHGVTVKADGVAQEWAEAVAEPRKRADFERYHLNRWVNQATAWIPVDWWDACTAPLPSDAELAACTGAIGIDMSQKIDLTAAVAVFRLPLASADDVAPLDVEILAEPEPDLVVRTTRSLNYRVAVVPMAWLPEETLAERVRRDHVRYDIWRDAGYLKATDGAIIDADAVVRWIKGGPGDLVSRFPLLKQGQVGYDPAFATELAVSLMALGFTCVEVLQNYKHLSEACQVFEALVKARRIVHGGNPLLRWCLENTAIKHDDAGRIRPVKPKKAIKRIDPIVATIIGISRLLAMPDTKKATSVVRVLTW